MGSLRAGTWWLLRILPKGRMRAEALVVAADSAERGVCAQGLGACCGFCRTGHLRAEALVVAADSVERNVCVQGWGRSPARLRALTHPFDISRAERGLLEVSPDG